MNDIIDEKAGPSRRSKPRWLNTVIIGTVLLTLVYGSTGLINAIAYLRQTANFSSSFQFLVSGNGNYSYEMHSNLAMPRLPTDLDTFDGKKILDLAALRSGKFRPNYQQLQWIKEPESISNDKGTYVIKSVNEENNDVSYIIKSIADESYEYTLFNSSSFGYGDIEYNIDSLVASPDLLKAVLKTNSTHNWRHSTFALYWVLDVEANTIIPFRDDLSEKIATFKWSPNLVDIAYVYKNNVYLKNSYSQVTTQVTFDGGLELFYGKPDWVYEEEVFASDIALWWSPTGSKVAFLKTNDTLVPEYTIPYFVQDDLKYQDYPDVRYIKYPKAGYPNPIVDIIVYSLATDSSELKLKSMGEVFDMASDIDDRLITEVVWVADESVLVKTSNRASDILDIFIINATTEETTLVRKETAEKSWFEITSNTIFVPRNETQGRLEDGYIDTVVVDGYNHLAYFSPPTNPKGKILTSGRWEVIDGVASLDLLNNEVYFIGTKKSSVERHLYSVVFTDKDPQIQNITDITTEGWYSASFSSGSRFLLLTYQGPNIPNQKLIDLYDVNHKYTIIEQNTKLIYTLDEYAIPKVNHQVLSLGVDENGNDIVVNAMETLPPGFTKTKKYPVLFFVYGGPGSQLVEKTFAVLFSAVVASQLNAVVVTVDGRGTGFNNHNVEGSNFKFIVRDKLGYYEPRDQIAAAKSWKSREYVDSDRIAIWGWSYGGFLTLKTLETDASQEEPVFSYGMSVAPVTKWRLYDLIYTERYMRTPQENPSGYETASIGSIGNFKNVTRFVVAHGTGDDNVHFQNTLKLVDELNLEAVENFDFFLFPDSDHSISFHNGGAVIYDRLLNWLRQAFDFKYI